MHFYTLSFLATNIFELGRQAASYIVSGDGFEIYEIMCGGLVRDGVLTNCLFNKLFLNTFQQIGSFFFFFFTLYVLISYNVQRNYV